MGRKNQAPLLGPELPSKASVKATFAKLYARKEGEHRVLGEYFSKPLSLSVRLGVSRHTLAQWADEAGVLQENDPLAQYLPLHLDIRDGVKTLVQGRKGNGMNSIMLFRAGFNKSGATADKILDLDCMDWCGGGRATYAPSSKLPD